jgi:chromate transporter
VAALLILLTGTSAAQIGAIVLGGLAGLWRCRSEAPAPSGHIEIRVSRRGGLRRSCGLRRPADRVFRHYAV